MKNTEWYPVYYNGLETNIEVTKCGRVKRVKKEWYGKRTNSYGEVDFSKLKLNNSGYRNLKIQINGKLRKSVLIHQLMSSAFLGYKWNGNKLVVDHIDSNKLNNRLDNLKLITQRENIAKERTLKSGLPVGVSYSKNINKYRSRISINLKEIYLGSFNTPEEASQAYQNKLKTIL
jgi:hypothetical protein